MNQMVEAWTWAGAHTVTYLQVMFLMVALFVVWYLAFNKKPSATRREVQMDATEEQVKRENEAVAQAIHDGLFEAYCKDEISRQRYNHEMKRLGQLLALPNLFSKIRFTHPEAIKATQRRLKTALTRRLPAEKVATAMAKAHEPRPKAGTKGNGKLNITVAQEK